MNVEIVPVKRKLENKSKECNEVTTKKLKLSKQLHLHKVDEKHSQFSFQLNDKLASTPKDTVKIPEKIANGSTTTSVSTETSDSESRKNSQPQFLHDVFSSQAILDCGQSGFQSFIDSLRKDVQGIKDIEERIDYRDLSSFLSALDDCQGQIVLSGIGKSGQVAQRFASSLSSVGIPSHFVQASEWIHGDLGKVQPGRDVVLFISHSGNTEECVTAAAHLIARGVTTLALTAGKHSRLRKLCVESLCYSSKDLQETFGCLPTTSIVLQEVLCNALLNELITRRGITREEFISNHPGGAIGTKK